MGGADVTKAEYDLTVYFNNTGTHYDRDNDNGMLGGHGNWEVLTQMFDSAVLRLHSGRGVEMATRTFPQGFACNRDAWLREEEALDCDLLKGTPLERSILDFVAISLMPWILMVLSFIVCDLIVFEKQNRLR